MNPLERLVYAISQRIVWLVTATVMRLFTNFYVQGAENLRALPTPLLIIANHRSYWDPMIIGTLFPFFSDRYLPIAYMAVDNLFGNILFRVFFLLTGTYPTYRGRGYDISLRYPRYVLKIRGVAMIFPFGKLDDGQEKIRPRRGIGIITREFQNLTILPIFLRTTPNLKLVNLLFSRKEMGVIVGKPFQIDDQIRQQDVEEIAQSLSDRIYSLRKE